MRASHIVIRNQLPFYCGPKDGGKYDLSNACPVCGTGEMRCDPIRLPGSRLKDRVAMTLKWEVVIPPRLVPAINAIAPQCLREIRDDISGSATRFCQLIPEMTLPPWGTATTGWTTSRMDPSCPNCGRDGYFNVPGVPLRLRYDRSVAPFKVAATYEYFGKSRLHLEFEKSLIADPFLVVAESVERILENERGLEFVPVDFEPIEETRLDG